MDIELSIKKIQGYKKLLDSFIRARNPYELRHFVIGKHVDRIQQFKQLLCEMDAKYKAIEEAQYNKKLKELEIEDKKLDFIIKPQTRKEEISNEKNQLEIFKLERESNHIYQGMLGALAECRDFAIMLDGEFSDLTDKTENELLEYEKHYYIARIAHQCELDILSNQKVSAGNLDAVTKMPKEDQIQVMTKAFKAVEDFKLFSATIEREVALQSCSSKPVLETPFRASGYIPLKMRKDAPGGYPDNRIVNMDTVEIMIATLHRPNDKQWISEEFYIPAGKNYIKRVEICPDARLIGEYKSRMVFDAISLGCTHLFIVDDDVLCDNSILQKLYQHKLDVVGAWYAKKTPVPESATLVLNGETKDPVPVHATGLVEVDWSLTAGCTLYSVEVFKKMEYPYFHTSDKGTEDTYFTQKALTHGIKSYLDTALKAGHVDKSTGDIYYLDKIIRGGGK